MSNYHLFAGDGYYPQSGLGDYVGPFTDLADAQAAGKDLCRITDGEQYPQNDWWVIVQEQLGLLVTIATGYANR